MRKDSGLAYEDRIAIEDLLTEISDAVDDGDADALGGCLTPEVSFDVGFGPINGRETVVALFRERLAKQNHEARHLWSNLSVLSREGNRVRLRSAFATFAVVNPHTDTAVRTWRCGDHLDIVEQSSDGTWLLAERKVGLLLPD